VAFELDERLAPHPGQEVKLNPLFGEAMLIVMNFRLVKVALNQNADLLAR